MQGFDLDHETNAGFAQTIHFKYDPQEAEKVIRQTQLNLIANKKAIIDAIAWKINQKTNSK